MRLERLSANPMHRCEAESEKFFGTKDEAEQSVNVNFPEFGAGTESFSHFVVSFTWADAEALIQQFIEIGQPEGLRLQRARSLASAVEDFLKP